MDYQVPQFIEVEDHIIGPLSLKQFIYLAGGIGLCVVCFLTLPLLFAILLSIPIGALGVALAFYKMNGKPFINVLEAGFNYYVGPKLFLWKHQQPKQPQAPEKAKEPEPSEGMKHAEPKLTRGKLSELAWSLDVKQPEDEDVES